MIRITDVDDGLNKIGGFGHHQRKVWLLHLLIYSMGSFALYPMGFYELQPEYQCRHFESDLGSFSLWYQCSRE